MNAEEGHERRVIVSRTGGSGGAMSSSARRRLLGALLAFTLTGFACAGDDGGEPREGPGDTVVMRVEEDFATLDPHKTKGTEGDYQMYMFLYDRLTARDENGDIVPHLAESWELSEENDSITMKLKEGVTCSDGTPLTPTAVAKSFERMQDAEGIYAYRTLGEAGLKSATADDEAGTVTLTLNAPHSDLLAGLAMPWASVVCPEGLKDVEALASQPSGSGLFALEESRRGDEYVLKARPDYKWGPNGATTSEPGFPQTLIVKPTDNTTTAANLLLSGDLDISPIVGQDLERVVADESLFRLDVPDLGGNGLMFNQAKGLPGADPRLREAVFMAIDAEEFNQANTFGQGEIMPTLYTPNISCYTAEHAELTPPYDPDAARQLLKEAGYSPGELTLRVVGYDTQNAGPEYLLEALERVGINAKLTMGDLNSYVDVVYGTGEWDFTAYPYASVLPSPSIFPGQFEPANTTDQDYFDFAKKALQEASTEEERCQFWSKFEEAVLKNFDTKPLNVYVTSWFGRDVEFSVFGLTLDPFSLRMK